MTRNAVDRARELAGYDEVSRLRQAQDTDWVLSLAATAPRTIADLGCGTGTLLEAARARWPTIERTLGIDGAEGRVAEAAARLGVAAEIERGDLLELAPRRERFDLITMTSVLHWLFPAEDRTFDWVAEHLTRDGSFVLTTHHPQLEGDGLGAEDVVAREAYAELGIDDFGDVLPMALRARPVGDVAQLLEQAFVVDAIEQRVVPVQTEDAEQYARFHASTFGTYFSRRVPDDREEEFFRAVGVVAERRQRHHGQVYPITVRAWRARPRWFVPR